MVEIREWPHKPKDSRRLFLNGQQVGFVNPKPGGCVFLLYQLLPNHLREIKQAVALMDAQGDLELATQLYDSRIIKQAPRLIQNDK